MARGATAWKLMTLTGALLVLVACGGTPSVNPTDPASPPVPGTTAAAGTDAPQAGGGGASTFAACDLLTDEQIEQITGHQVQGEEAKTVSGLYENGCEWTFDDVTSLTLGVLSPGGRSYYETYFEAFIGEEHAPISEVVQGVGDKAGRGDLTGVLMAVKGDTLLDMQYIEFGADEDAKVLELMKLAIAALP